MIRHWREIERHIPTLPCSDTKVWVKWMQGSSRETTLNPETRMMKRIEIEDARMASGVTEMLMGTEVPPRRAFIYENATEAELDI